ncbi:hypothetical protein NGM10_14275 [Halorussus salilacus]|uniref:hypothetical protein n=1 Tax=Halorussus salilacus TaxID=2953750 RepID=UPI0020A060C0|nr:hypothetical protein [Halorussus salilacus]USZ67886.1 hypothetical protein NGM10_14275 [Halorussus salilacus]
MATEGTSRGQWAVRLLFLGLVLAPLALQFGGALGDDLPAPDAAVVVRALGLGVVLGIVALLVLQKRRSRGQKARDAPERPGDRETEGTARPRGPARCTRRTRTTTNSARGERASGYGSGPRKSRRPSATRERVVRGAKRR